VALTNAGSITVSASANATATGTYIHGTPVAGDADARARVDSGIEQMASASGYALVTRTITPTDDGVTIEDTFAGAATASATLDNSGAIDIMANAAASGGDANAVASIGQGIDQEASAFAASAA
jgi:hypothetical protein